MENSNNTNENLQVATFDPARTYANASQLQLSESEMKALTAPFEDLDYEITPQGHIYIPQVLSLKRLNDVIGVGRWSLLLINTGSQVIKDGLTKVFYDGALIVRNCFVARSAGEASYSEGNAQQSYASALEAAKSDCRQRCVKDLGIASDAWNPSFIRRWQAEHAVKVVVEKDNRRFTIWRRKDLPPFDNEVGLAVNVPTVQQKSTAQNTAAGLPWLNEGTADYDNAVKQLIDGKLLSSMAKEFRISKAMNQQLVEKLMKVWEERLATCNTLQVLTASYNDNKAEVDEYGWLKKAFADRRDAIKSGTVKTNAA